jgi:YHS domain-containing protein
MQTIKTLIATATLIGGLAAGAPAFALDEYNVSTGTTVSGLGVALRGNDAVALATGLEVTPGQAVFTVEHDGVAYYFAAEATMQRFAADPDRYLPQYGGFCTLGVAKGKKLDANPRFADIVDGKLYVFLNAAVFDAYQEDKEGILAQAAANWPAMHHVAVAEVNG